MSVSCSEVGQDIHVRNRLKTLARLPCSRAWFEGPSLAELTGLGEESAGRVARSDPPKNLRFLRGSLEVTLP